MELPVTAVDPIGLADEASRLLREVWPPPSAHYTADYLRWEFGFPGPARPLAVVARDDGGLAGFAAVAPRLARFRERRLPVYLLSFVAVRQAYRGQGVAARLYAALLGTVREAGMPVVTFAFPGSAGERSLLRAYDAAGFVRRPLGTYVVHGFAPRPAPPGAGGEATAEAAFGEVSHAAEACAGRAVLWSAPDPDQLDHYRRDPRGRVALVARGTGGEVTAAALVVCSEVVTAEGLEAVTVVDALFAPRPEAPVVRSLFERAGRCFAGKVRSRLVLAPNVRTLPPDVLRAAGLRQLPQRVEGYLCAADASDPLLQAETTNLEVI
jgi:GNAT superfamily N-acetyltransferase